MTRRRFSSRYVNVVSVGQVTRDEIYGDFDVPTQADSQVAPQHTRVGGKAFNQAVAAARMGADVTLVSAVGTDRAAADIKKALTREAVRTDVLVSCQDGRRQVESVVVRLHEVPRGERKVTVLQEPIFVGCYETAVQRARQRILDADIVIVTFEFGAKALSGIWTNLQLLKEHKSKALIVLNPAPEISGVKSIVKGLRVSDVVVPNRWEARALVEDSGTLRGQDLAKEISDMYGSANVCVTLGAEGAAWYTSGSSGSVPAMNVRPVDKVGASDVFTGVLAIAFWHSDDFEASVRLANIAAGMAVERSGGADAAPNLKELLDRCGDLSPRRVTRSVSKLASELAELASYR